jgi:hypothetical protein
MRRTIAALLVLAVIAAATGGCATILKGSSEEVFLVSEPSGADVYIAGQLRGSTPLELDLESEDTYAVEFQMEGYRTAVHNIAHSVGAGWVILDVVCGLFPVIIDAVTGAWYSLEDTNVSVVLEPEGI